MAAKRKAARHWSREETLALISVWSEPTFQIQFENCIHNHKVWEAVYKKVCEVCPSIQNTFDWVKCKDHMEYLKRRYRECVKHNKKTGSDPQRCPFFEELDSVLACRPMTNPGDGHMDASSSEEGEITGTSSNSSGIAEPSGDKAATFTATEDDSGQRSEQTTNTGQTSIITRRKRKGKKTQIMEAMERGINLLIQHDIDTTAAELEQHLNKEHMAWERQIQQARLDLEKARLEFEIKRQEAEDRSARETQQFMVQMLQVLRPAFLQHVPSTSFAQYQHPAQQYYSSDPFAFSPGEASHQNPSTSVFQDQGSLSDQRNDH